MVIRKYRLEKGLSQEQLADMAGVSARTIQRLERGAKATPETLKCLAAALDVDFAALRKDDDMPEALSSTSPIAPAVEDHVRDIKAFYLHAIRYALVMLLLLVINLWVSPGFLWVVFPAIGWGIGLAAHGLSAFQIATFFGPDWERREIARRLRK